MFGSGVLNSLFYLRPVSWLGDLGLREASGKRHGGHAARWWLAGNSTGEPVTFDPSRIRMRLFNQQEGATNLRRVSPVLLKGVIGRYAVFSFPPFLLPAQYHPIRIKDLCLVHTHTHPSVIAALFATKLMWYSPHLNHSSANTCVADQLQLCMCVLFIFLCMKAVCECKRSAETIN